MASTALAMRSTAEPNSPQLTSLPSHNSARRVGGRSAQSATMSGVATNGVVSGSSGGGGVLGRLGALATNDMVSSRAKSCFEPMKPWRIELRYRLVLPQRAVKILILSPSKDEGSQATEC